MYLAHNADSLCANPPTRRVVSMPTIRVPFVTPVSPVLPLSAPNLSSPSRARSTSRRLSYNLKSRASHYSLPLALAGACAFLLFLLSYTRSPRTDRVHLYNRSTAQSPVAATSNGISFLTSNEDELIAEDDLFWDKYTDPEPLTQDEIAEQQELQAHHADVQKLDREHALRALIWWLAEGGIIPADWEMPSASFIKRLGGRGMERLLEGIDKGDDNEAIFAEGWADFAKTMYRTVVFSKTYCPYSKKAKSILDKYHLSPAPFVIELDRRTDYSTIQTLLQRLTGRRTVPNVILDFVSVGGSDELTLLNAEGGLRRQLEEMQVVSGPRRRRPASDARPVEPVVQPIPVHPIAVVEPVEESREALYLEPEDRPVIPPHGNDDVVKRAVAEAHVDLDALAEEELLATLEAEEMATPEADVQDTWPTLLVQDEETPDLAIDEPEPIAPRKAKPPVVARVAPIATREEDSRRAVAARDVPAIARDESRHLPAREAPIIAGRTPPQPLVNREAPVVPGDKSTRPPARVADAEPQELPVRRDIERVNPRAPRLIQAPNPRQIKSNGIAALAAAARIHRVRP